MSRHYPSKSRRKGGIWMRGGVTPIAPSIVILSSLVWQLLLLQSIFHPYPILNDAFSPVINYPYNQRYRFHNLHYSNEYTRRSVENSSHHPSHDILRNHHHSADYDAYDGYLKSSFNIDQRISLGSSTVNCVGGPSLDSSSSTTSTRLYLYSPYSLKKMAKYSHPFTHHYLENKKTKKAYGLDCNIQYGNRLKAQLTQTPSNNQFQVKKKSRLFTSTKSSEEYTNEIISNKNQTTTNHNASVFQSSSLSTSTTSTIPSDTANVTNDYLNTSSTTNNKKIQRVNGGVYSLGIQPYLYTLRTNEQEANKSQGPKDGTLISSDSGLDVHDNMNIPTSSHNVTINHIDSNDEKGGISDLSISSTMSEYTYNLSSTTIKPSNHHDTTSNKHQEPSFNTTSTLQDNQNMITKINSKLDLGASGNNSNSSQTQESISTSKSKTKTNMSSYKLKPLMLNPQQRNLWKNVMNSSSKQQQRKDPYVFPRLSDFVLTAKPSPSATSSSTTTSSEVDVGDESVTGSSTAGTTATKDDLNNAAADDDTSQRNYILRDDLESFLRANGYMKRDEFFQESTAIPSGKSSNKKTNRITKRNENEIDEDDDSDTSTSSSKKNKGKTVQSKSEKKGVALPQPSIISNYHIKIGTSIASSIFSCILFTSLQPNLWMLGVVIGSIYGHDIAVRATTMTTSTATSGGSTFVDNQNLLIETTTIPGGLYGDASLRLGKRIAKGYLSVYDTFQAVWFMYKTGQLSYEYYKRYETLDKRFALTNKMDAWNARFVEGKENFDRWEKENEISRKALAGLRTVWLLEETSYKNQQHRISGGRKRRKSKYRLIQYANNALYWIQDLVAGRLNGEFKEFVRGIQIQLSSVNLDIFSERLGAVAAALFFVNFIGVLFALAPYLLGLVAIIIGCVFPNFVGESVQQIQDVLAETRARGRGEKYSPITKKKSKPKKNNIIDNLWVDRKKFSYFLRKDGTKQWYRIRSDKEKNDYGIGSPFDFFRSPP